MFTGIILALLSGVCLGTCFLPMRYMKQFAWENTWFIWCLFALIIFPPIIAFLTIPDILGVLKEVGWRLNLIILGVGLVAGTSGILFGVGLSRVGMTLANSLSNGVSLVLGSFVPLVIQHRNEVTGKIGITLIIGLLLSLIGVIICAVAGAQQTGDSAYSEVDYKSRSRTFIALQGVGLCIAAGLLTPLLNFGIAFADDYMLIARKHGASEVFMTFAFYIPYLGTSFVSNAIYCFILWKRNQTHKQFRDPSAPKFVMMAASMAVIWMVGMLFYGWAMPSMKSYGPVIGWPISLVSTSIASAIVEYLYGDWHGKAWNTLKYGLMALIISIGMFAYANLIIQNLMN